jgi:Fe-S cluster assembly protein SufD
MTSLLLEAERLAAARQGADASWVADVRRAALARVRELGFPTTRDEEWRFTSVSAITEGGFALAADGVATVQPRDLTPFNWDGDRAATLVFVNGRYAAALSQVGPLPAGVRVEPLAPLLGDNANGPATHLARAASADRRAFTALNTAFLADGALLFVPDNTRLAAPIHVVFLSAPEPAPAMSHPRVLVVMGESSEASIVESFGASGAASYLTNAVTEIVAGENATLTHYKVQREHADSFHLGAIYVHAARNATVACHSLSLGGSLVRNDILAVLDGEGAHCTLNGLYLADGARLVDNHTTIDHARPNCDSREVYKGILADRARAVFNGKIVVRPDAQKTDAKQTNKALLLSEDAQINTKPQLEIFANDVKCTHGAAVGQMDEDAIFYLRARGIGAPEAREILVHAFAGDVLNQMPLVPLRTRIDEDLSRRLARWRA